MSHPSEQKSRASAHHHSCCQQEGLVFPSLHPGVGGVCCTDIPRSLTHAVGTHPAMKAPPKEVCDEDDTENHGDTSSPLSALMTYQDCSKHFTGIRFRGCIVIPFS